MKYKKFFITFESGETLCESAFYTNDAAILAMAEQIKRGLTKKIEKIVDEHGNYKPIPKLC